MAAAGYTFALGLRRGAFSAGDSLPLVITSSHLCTDAEGLTSGCAFGLARRFGTATELDAPAPSLDARAAMISCKVIPVAALATAVDRVETNWLNFVSMSSSEPMPESESLSSVEVLRISFPYSVWSFHGVPRGAGMTTMSRPWMMRRLCFASFINDKSYVALYSSHGRVSGAGGTSFSTYN